MSLRPLLMYHGVGPPAPRVADEGHYNVSADELDRQLAVLARHRVIGLDELLAGEVGVALTFDDGERSVLTEVAPRLAARGLPAIVYVTSGLLGEPGYLRQDEVRRVCEAGLSIGAHGHTHRMLSDLPDAELTDELVRSREVLSELAGAPVVHMSLPGGRGGGRVVAAARRAGYRSVATSRVGRNGRVDAFDLTRVAVTSGLPEARFEALLAGDLRAYAPAMARERALALVKLALGTRRYDALRGAARRALGE